MSSNSDLQNRKGLPVRIASNSIALPGRLVSNDDVLETIRARSPVSQCLEPTIEMVGRLLARNGSHTRHWLAENEDPRELILRACTRAMNEAGGKVDLLIFAGIWNDVHEPSFANLLAWQLGLNNVACFDIKAGCDGWMRAAMLAESLLGNTFERIMVVNAEFNVNASEAILPLYTITKAEQLQWRFPAFTIGEAVTATVFENSEIKWKWRTSARNDHADLCTAMEGSYGKYPLPSKRIAPDGAGLFTSYGADLLKVGIPEATRLFGQLGVAATDVRMVCTHSSSVKDWAAGIQAVDTSLAKKAYDISSQCGNVVSASIPAALAIAHTRGDLKRGESVALINASAGMAFSAAYIPSF